MQERVPNFQRVLILQGGGSLGAYEAGVYQALHEMVTKSDKERGFKNKPIVDIVAGTSIGAINSAVLVSYVIENNTWEGSSERLNEFWEYLSKESSVDYIYGFTEWWDYLHNNVNHDIATGEAARRYYTASIMHDLNAWCRGFEPNEFCLTYSDILNIALDLVNSNSQIFIPLIICSSTVSIKFDQRYILVKIPTIKYPNGKIKLDNNRVYNKISLE